MDNADDYGPCPACVCMHYEVDGCNEEPSDQDPIYPPPPSPGVLSPLPEGIVAVGQGSIRTSLPPSALLTPPSCVDGSGSSPYVSNGSTSEVS